MKSETQRAKLTPLNQLIRASLLGFVFLGSASIVCADGFQGANVGDVDLEDYACEDCPVLEDKSFLLNFSLGYLDDEAYRFQRYSSIEEGFGLFLSGEAVIREDDGWLWKTKFHNLGLDSGGIHSELGIQGLFNIEFDYQNIPLTYQSNLRSPYRVVGNELLLNPIVQVSSSALFDNVPLGYSKIDLVTDWQRLGLNVEWQDDSNFSFEWGYKRLNKDGFREYSVAQLLNASYIPLPVNNETDDLTASINWHDDSFYASVSALISQFDNNVSSVTVEYPFTALQSGSEAVQFATAPDNTYTRVNINLRYLYSDRSHVKLAYSNGLLEQDDSLLDYSLNPLFQSPLPVEDLNAEVETESLNLQLLHRFSKDWRLKVDYREHDRDNKTPIYSWDRLITDLYLAGSVTNLPYDYNSKTTSATLSFNMAPMHRFNVKLRNHEKERTFQQVRSNSEDGYEFQYVGRVEDVRLNFVSEYYDRDSSEKTLIDYLEVTENPLLSRFNVAEREQFRQRFMASYDYSDNLNISLTSSFSNQDYKQADIGLSENEQLDYGLDIGWIINETSQLTLYYQEQEIQTSFAGSSSFANPDWFADSEDLIESFGLDMRFSELFEKAIDLTISVNHSNASSDVAVMRAGQINELPKIDYDWTQAEIKLSAPWSENVDVEFTYQYQNFSSQDYALDLAVPGEVVQLLTLGDVSDDYRLNYIQISAIYRF